MGWGKLTFFLPLAAVLCGCTTYQQQGLEMTTQWRAGNVQAAAAAYSKKAQSKAKSKDAIIWKLEEATALRVNGRFQESIEAFKQAEALIDRYEETARVKLSQEAAALLVNQALLPYEGRTYDKIMLNTYKALNYMNLGDIDRARVELIRAYQRQQDAVEINRRRIEKVQEEAAKRREKEIIQKAENDGQFKQQISGLSPDLNSLAPYADYVNPFTVFLDGLFFMATATGPSDLERARKSFERVMAFSPGNRYVANDLETVKQLLQGKRMPPTTYVIFETGRAPIREQVRIDIPIIITRVSYVGAAFPKLVMQPDYVTGLEVRGGNCVEKTALVCSMDSVIGREFKNELPIIITKTLVSTMAKATANYFINDAMERQDEVLGLLSRLLTAGAQAAVNIADLRTWTTLPKEFQYCRLPTPPDRKLTITTANGLQKTDYVLQDGVVNVVLVRSISPSTPMWITQFKLQ